VDGDDGSKKYFFSLDDYDKPIRRHPRHDVLLKQDFQAVAA
jgi:hypothetical protein